MQSNTIDSKNKISQETAEKLKTQIKEFENSSDGFKDFFASMKDMSKILETKEQ